MSKFRLDPEAALQIAIDFGCDDVVIIGRDEDGDIHFWSSQNAEDTCDLIEEGVDAVQTLAVNEDRDARVDEDES